MELKEDQYVQVDKLSEHGTRYQEDIVPGYQVKGTLFTIPTIGEPLIIARTQRNGVNVAGVFNTSPLKAFDQVSDTEYVLRTENSTYKLTVLQN